MLQIGFSTKYFTLWNVSTETKYRTVNHKHYACGVNTHYTYIQNLSMDLDKAIEKAKGFGCTDLAPYDDLHGKSKSFTKYTPIDYGVGYFNGGKYEGTLISECNDLDYLLWTIDAGYGSIEIKKRICELDDSFYLNDEELKNKKEEQGVSVYDRICNGEIELRSLSNFSEPFPNDDQTVMLTSVKATFNPSNDDEEEFLRKYPYGFPVQFEINKLPVQLVKKYYQGYEYYTPVGKKSFKGIKFTVKENEITFI